MTGLHPARRASNTIECAAQHLALLIRWYALHILNLLLHVLNDFNRLHLKLDCFAGKHPHENLHTAMQTSGQCSINFVLILYSTRTRSSSILQALHITCKAVTVHYPCTWLPTVEPTLWHKTKCSGARQQPDTKPIPPASTPELDYEEA